jgi:hypothetical protein
MAKGTGQRGRPRKVPANGSDAAPQQAANNGPTNDQIAEALADYTTMETQAARVRQGIKTMLDNFEKLGGDKAELKALHKSMKLDPREAQAKLERRLRYHAGQGIVVSWTDTGQGTVIDQLGPEMQAPAKNTKGQRDLAAARAHSDGYNSGLRGSVPSDNPFSANPGSEEYVQWHDGRDDGQRDREAKNPALRDRIAAAAIADASLPAGAETADSPIF